MFTINLANQPRYSVSPVVTYTYGYEGSLVEEMTMILFTFTASYTNACDTHTVGATEVKQRFLNCQMGWYIVFIDLSLPSPSNFLIKTCVFFLCSMRSFMIFSKDFVFLNTHAYANKSGFC